MAIIQPQVFTHCLTQVTQKLTGDRSKRLEGICRSLTIVLGLLGLSFLSIVFLAFGWAFKMAEPVGINCWFRPLS